MGTTLTGTTIASTYDGLIKIGNNDPASATLQTLSDGLGNDLPIDISTGSINFTSDVGINTTTPAHKLDVVSGEQCVAKFESTVAGGGIAFVDDGTANDDQVGIGAFDDDLCLRAGGQNNAVRVKSTGDVGIGTATPSKKLEVTGEISGSDVFIDDHGSVSASLANIEGDVSTNATNIANLEGGSGNVTSVNGLEGDVSVVAGTDIVVNLNGSNIEVSSSATDTTYTAGNGLDLAGTTFAADFAAGTIITDAGAFTTADTNETVDQILVYKDDAGEALKANVDDFKSAYNIVDKTGTPVNNQLGVWTDANTLEGDSDLTWNGTVLGVQGDITTNDIRFSGEITFSALTTANTFTGEMANWGTFPAQPTVGKVYYYAGTNNYWILGNNTTLAGTTGVLGIACTGNKLLIRGYYRTSQTFTAGEELWFNSTGTITGTQPSGGNYARLIGHAISANIVYFNPSQEYILTS